MNRDAMIEEIVSPSGLGEELESLGLIPVQITLEEFELASHYGTAYLRLSIHDRIALAIAKVRGISLLTGDGALRRAAEVEGVPYIGTLGILDQLWESQLVTKEEYRNCLEAFIEQCSKGRRLPKNELLSRLRTLNEPQ